MNNTKKITLLFLTALLLSCTPNLKKFKAHFFSMDTMVEVTLFVKSNKKGDAVLKELKKETSRIEKLFSAYIKGSEVQKINSRKSEKVVVNSEVSALIKKALAFNKATNGLFDITTGPIKWLWGFGTEMKFYKPTDDEISSVLKHTGCDKISQIEDTLIFSDPETKIDLGGISKGYALLKMKEIIEQNKITSYMINAGGDIICGEKKPDGKEWSIGIRHPREKGSLIKVIRVTNNSVVTSGDYERFFFGKDSVRYHHIFDPTTGFPARGIISATVICKNPIQADVYSTTLVVQGKRYRQFKLKGIEQAILFDNELKELVIE